VKRDTFLGLDIGTLGVKGVVATADGEVLARVRRDHGASQPRPGWVEQDAAAQWWGDGAAVVRDLLATPGVDPDRLAGVGVCGLTPCLCLVDDEGRPLRPAILYSDHRALEQLARARAAGLALTAQAISPKWAWLAEHEPETLRAARRLFSSHNYVVHRLTGVASMDYDTASIVGGVFDVRAKRWDAAACAALGLDVRLLPPPRAATDVVGGVTADAARATGLPQGAPVIVGTGDTFPTIVGCGAVAPGDAMISFGATGLLTLTMQPLETAAAGPHFAGGDGAGAVAWAANVLTCGRLLAWYRDAFGASVVGAGLVPALEPALEAGHMPALEAGPVPAPTYPPDFALLDRCAAAVPAGSDGLIALPHLLGRRTPAADPQARGVLFGLNPAHTAAHGYRALLESFGYAVRRGFEPIRPQVRRVIATAGGAASPLWRQIVADILNAPLQFHPRGSGALGIAFLAAYALGCLRSFDIVRDAWLANPEHVLPDPAVRGCYDDLYGLYCHLDDGLAAAYARLSAARTGERQAA
jgi:xylulokinase